MQTKPVRFLDGLSLGLPAYVQNAQLPALVGVQLYLTAWQRISAQVEFRYPYYIQEMTVRLGAVTKRVHAEAIFDGFEKFWGWFSIFDLAFINWLTLVTEYIGMTQAMRLFVAVTLLSAALTFLIE
jgi:hypothetical protein